MFARLRPCLEDAWELAAPGEVFVVGGKQGDAYRTTAQKPGGWINTNLRSVMLKLIRRAGLVPWPKVFQNLRASCETDLRDHTALELCAKVLETQHSEDDSCPSRPFGPSHTPVISTTRNGKS